ncbi:MAG: transporter [Deltaproteobacteria bacterium]|jgi:hypothetical protein|nr:transporter [Deltaproteobacteria bacterium]
MKTKRLVCLFALAAFMLVCPNGNALAAAHFTSGGDGYKMATLPTDGMYYKMYNIYYTSNTLKDNSGTTVPGGNHNVNNFGQLHRFGYVTGQKILGADWLIDVAIPLSYTKLSGNMAGTGSSRSGGGLGDVLLSPLLLSWHFENFDMFLSPAVWLPVGDYDKNDATSSGLGYWGLLPSAAATIYLDQEKNANLSFITRFEYNFTNTHNDTRVGNIIHQEWSLGRTFRDSNIDLALTGAHSWQISDSHGMGAGDDRRFRKHAIGPEIGYSIPDWKMNLNLRCLFEFESRNTTQGNMFVLSILKAF